MSESQQTENVSDTSISSIVIALVVIIGTLIWFFMTRTSGPGSSDTASASSSRRQRQQARKSSKREHVVVFGPSNSGKTALLNFVDIQQQPEPENNKEEASSPLVPTVMSMRERWFKLQIGSAEEDNDDRKLVSVVDFPGHYRLRPQLFDFLPSSKALVMVVDANDNKSWSKAAEMLFDVFTDPSVSQDADADDEDVKRKILILCNKVKRDSQVAQKVRRVLEKELTELARTRASLMQEGGSLDEDEDKGEGSSRQLCRPGQPFDFKLDAPCVTKFGTSEWLEQGSDSSSVKELLDFLQDE